MRINTLALSAIFSAFALTGCKNSEYSWENDLQHRLETDFCRERSEVTEYIRKYIPDVTESEIDSWTSQGKLESMFLNGKRMYFRNAGPNLFRIDAGCKAIKDSIEGPESSSAYTLGVRNIYLSRENSSEEQPLGLPCRMRVKYTLTVDADAVPDGEKIRCWLPYPRTDVNRQKNVKFIEAGWTTRPSDTSAPLYFRTEMPQSEELEFSGNEASHSTLYMEAVAAAGWPTTFYEEFEYTSYAECHNADTLAGIAERQAGKAAEEGLAPSDFLDEREAHIRFGPRILALRDSLTEGITNPVLKAQTFYKWIDSRFPWASAREYSTIGNIPEYVLESGHGDCGQVSLLFITLCRSADIPAHFQTGFMMHPSGWNLHDWAEIWVEGYGWVPVDQSFGSDSYFGSIDAYRMIVNNDFGRQLKPAKKYPRSETVDFQRGEVEWSGGNLYFTDWDYDMDIQYL